MNKGFQQYEEFWGNRELSSVMLLVKSAIHTWIHSDKGAVDTRKAVRNWLKHDWNPENPFFIFAHFMEPHIPYGRPSDYLEDFLPAGASPETALQVNQDPHKYITGKAKMNEADFVLLNALYNSNVRYVDDTIGYLVKMLREQNLLDKTLVIFTTDHGETFNEHNILGHVFSVYDVLIHVPLIIRFPYGEHSGLKIQEQVRSIDLFPSILSLLNINATGLELQGVNLLPGKLDPAIMPYAFTEYDNSRDFDKLIDDFGKDGFEQKPICKPKKLKSIRSLNWKLIWGTDGTRELYAIDKDPGETRNVFHEFPEEGKHLEKTLLEWWSSFKHSDYYKEDEMTPDVLKELRSLGYVN